MDSLDFWVGANDTVVEGVWAWQDGTPVRMGTPLWATYGTSSCEQEPRPSYSPGEDCACMEKTRYYGSYECIYD